MLRGYEEIASTCACFHFRKASRAVTSLYDETLSPVGVKSTQFVVLLVLALHKEVSMSDCANALSVDRTTFSRIVKPLVKKGLIKVVSAAEDKRKKQLALSVRGVNTLNRAIPCWKRAQGRVVDLYGASRWDKLIKELGRTGSLVV